MNPKIKELLDAICWSDTDRIIRAKANLVGNRRKFTDDEKKALDIANKYESIIDVAGDIATAMIEAYFPDYATQSWGA